MASAKMLRGVKLDKVWRVVLIQFNLSSRLPATSQLPVISELKSRIYRGNSKAQIGVGYSLKVCLPDHFAELGLWRKSTDALDQILVGRAVSGNNLSELGNYGE
mmetsp:Transcript_13109/g.26595  ORF Transcript_13109/g.26595 Transcript_13109/m.26595 type:complete len:104 (+) Transcript_13109:2091-2402(+)